MIAADRTLHFAASSDQIAVRKYVVAESLTVRLFFRGNFHIFGIAGELPSTVNYNFATDE
jgi:hypothetical protein